MIKKIYLLIPVLSLSSILATSDIYQRFNVKQSLIDATLNSAITTKIDSAKQLPADISFVAADVKYKDGRLKFCECGDGIYMSFRAADIELNGYKQNVVSPYWGIFWHYLNRFKIPIWHIGSTGPTNSMAMHELEKIGGKHYANLCELEQDALFKRLCKQNFKKTNAIKNHKGIIVYRAKTEQTREADTFIKFRQAHPEFLFVNAIAREYVKRKDNTYKLFSAAQLHDYIPHFSIYPTGYSPKLAQQICDNFDTDLLIIKPVFSSLSNGVNAIDKNNLDSLLKLILHNKKDINVNSHRSISHWRKSRASSFVASEYVHSKIIYKDGKPYDPTMRIVFMLHHDNNIITTTPIAGFWKIPVKSLADKASLTEQHITIAHAGAYYSGIMVDSQDWCQIKDILHVMLPQLYITMLAQRDI